MKVSRGGNGARVGRVLRILGTAGCIIITVGAILYLHDPAKPSYYISSLFFVIALIPICAFSYSLLFLAGRSIVAKTIIIAGILIYSGTMTLLIALQKNCYDGVSVELMQLVAFSGLPALMKFYLKSIIICLMIWLVVSIILSWLVLRMGKRESAVRSKKYYLAIAAFSFIVFGMFAYQCNPAGKTIANLRYTLYAFYPEYIKHTGVKLVNMTADDISVAGPGRNLVYIILESTEKNFLGNAQYPGLLPNLEALSRDSVFFENIAPADNAYLTFGGIYASMMGTYLTPAHLQDQRTARVSIGSKLGSLPKILDKAGYRQHFLYAHSSWFRGFNAFLVNEKYEVNQISGKSRRLLDESLFFDASRDSVLYEKAWECFQELAADGKSFNLTLLTLDAHGPDGMYSPDEPAYPENKQNIQLLNAIYASDDALGRFVRKLQQHPLWKDTCLVIQSDHLAHNNTHPEVLAGLVAKDTRKLLFMICNSGKKSGNYPVNGMTFDIAPTILDALGIQHNYTFLLGENLFGDTDPTRLNCTNEQRSVNQMVVLCASDYKLNLGTYGIRFDEEPYPTVRLGALNIPIYIANTLSNDVPVDEECFLICFSEDMEIYQKIIYFSNMEEMKKFILNP